MGEGAKFVEDAEGVRRFPWRELRMDLRGEQVLREPGNVSFELGRLQRLMCRPGAVKSHPLAGGLFHPGFCFGFGFGFGSTGGALDKQE